MKSKLFVVFILAGLILAGCGTTKAQPTEVPVAPTETQATEQQETGGGTSEIPNPASQYCVDQGYELEIRSDESGNQYGVCIFPDGSECEEWAFFRGECTYQPVTGGETGGVPNPASENCINQGYELEIRSDESGNQYGVCIFPDGSECEEWAFFRGECTYQGE